MRTSQRLINSFFRDLHHKDTDTQLSLALVRLWKNWSEVVGGHVAELAKPLGHRKRTLIVGAEDSMVMQELTYYSPQILADVHAFFGQEVFDKVQLELVMGKTPLDEVSVPEPLKGEYRPPERPRRLGTLSGTMRDDSPVARCYEAYVRFFDGRK